MIDLLYIPFGDLTFWWEKDRGLHELDLKAVGLYFQDMFDLDMFEEWKSLPLPFSSSGHLSGDSSGETRLKLLWLSQEFPLMTLATEYETALDSEWRIKGFYS